MSVGDMVPLAGAGRHAVPTYRFERDDRDTSSEASTVKAGEPTKASTTSSQYVVKLVDADLTIATDQTFTGVGASESTETASADGRVELYMPLSGIVYQIKAKSAAAADSESEILALKGEYHVIDLTSSTFTLDTAAGDGATNAFLIVGGDPRTSTIHVIVREDATVFGRARV